MTAGSTGRCSAARETRECQVCGWRRFDPHTRRSLVCLPCEARMSRLLDELRTLARLLPAVVESAPGNFWAVVDAHDLGLPGRVRVASGDRDDQIGYGPVTSALAEWVRVWHEQGAPDRARIGFGSIGSVVAWLKAHLDWACAHCGEVDEFGRVLRRQVSAVRRVLNVDTSPKRFEMPCAACGTQTLVRIPAMPPEPGAEPSDPWIECRTCGRLWSDDEYQAAKLDALRASIPTSVLLTANEIGLARGIPARRIRVWAHRGRLHADIGPWAGRKVYLLANVDDLIEADEREAVAV